MQRFAHVSLEFFSPLMDIGVSLRNRSLSVEVLEMSTSKISGLNIVAAYTRISPGVKKCLTASIHILNSRTSLKIQTPNSLAHSFRSVTIN